MKNLIVWLGFAVLSVVSIPAYGGNVETITFTPTNPMDSDNINVLISGYWSTSCEQGQGAPAVSRMGSGISITVPYNVPQPGIICATVILPFSFTVPI